MKKSYIKSWLWFVVMCMLLSAGKVHTQEKEISISSVVDRSIITIGDLIKYTLTITRNENLEIETLGLAANLGMFEIRDYQVFEPEKNEDNIIEKFEYTITTFDTGSYVIPPYPLAYYEPPDTSFQIIMSEPIAIRVESVKPSEATDIRDIKPQLTIARSWRKVILYSAIGLGVLILVFFIWYYIHRKRAGKGLLPERKKPIRPAHEVALESLKNLESGTLLSEGKIKKYFTALSDIIRIYFEGRYFINATEMTTSQILEALTETNTDAETIQIVGEFLQMCDLIKFAKYIPEPREIVDTTGYAYTIVQNTKIELIVTPQEHKDKTGITEESIDSSSKEQELQNV